MDLPDWVPDALINQDISGTECQFLVALFASGQRRVEDGSERVYWDGDPTQLPGAPSARWLRGPAGIRAMVKAGIVAEHARTPRPGVPGRPGLSLSAPVSIALSTTVLSEPPLDAGKAQETLHPIPDSIEPGQEPPRAHVPDSTTTAAPPSPPPPHVVPALLHVLQVEKVTNPAAVMAEFPLNTVGRAVQELADARRRGDVIGSPAKYVMGIVTKAIPRSPVTDWAFLDRWAERPPAHELDRQRFRGRQ